MGLLLLHTINANLQTGQQTKRKQLSVFSDVSLFLAALMWPFMGRSFRSDLRLQIYI